MATGIAEIIVLGLLVDWLLRRCGVPGLIGMMAVGALLGPHMLNYMAPDLIGIGDDLRLIALIVILLRAGFALNRRVLHQTGGRILLLAFVPATGEGIFIAMAGQWLLDLPLLEAALLGSVVAAVSPAVIVPAMLRFIQEGRGQHKGIPTMVMAAASVDDVYVIVAHSALLGAYMGTQLSLLKQVAGVPVSLVLGSAAGMGIGWLLCLLFDHFNPRATKRILIVIALAILLVRLQSVLAAVVPFAGLVSTMAIGYTILERREQSAHEIAAKLAKIWVFAEIILFSMVGAQVNLTVAWQTGLAGAAVIGIGLLARSTCTLACLIGSSLNKRERAFVMLAFLPKATVQAAIGAGPLLAMRAANMDTHAGEIILAVAVLSIVLTAPLGAWAIACAGPRLLAKD